MNEMVTPINEVLDLHTDQDGTANRQIMIFGGSYHDATWSTPGQLRFMGWFNIVNGQTLLNGEATIPCGPYAGCNMVTYVPDPNVQSYVYIMVVLYDDESPAFKPSTNEYHVSLKGIQATPSDPDAPQLFQIPTATYQPGRANSLARVRISHAYDHSFAIGADGQLIFNANGTLQAGLPAISGSDYGFGYFTKEFVLDKQSIQVWSGGNNGNMFGGTYEIWGDFEVYPLGQPDNKRILKFDPRVRVGPPFS